MMMPEHVQMLKGIREQQEYKEKPMISDYQKEEINTKLQLAIHDDLTVIVKYYKSNDHKKVRGKLDTVDVMSKHILLRNGTRIKLQDVIELQID
ncbi:hypothetical protein GMD78_08950 [Ornithinibacillus sp. L9]|uniref:YolD-like protein n=1 Tax=Ornithinibacillus caprae TaxID=2678566 RepID=A0A6N8FL45_9BACI|nr:YolD-like family protein [Ornithinibacillus caprae]MUK88519.1 hypothetical protein [Ornithinibacillus caprae]